MRPADVAAMARAVRDRAAAAAAAPSGREDDLAPPVRYERRRCVAQIAGVLDRVAGVTPPAAALAA